MVGFSCFLQITPSHSLSLQPLSLSTLFPSGELVPVVCDLLDSVCHSYLKHSKNVPLWVSDCPLP